MENPALDFFGFWAISNLIADNNIRSSYDFMADWIPAQDNNANVRINEYVSDWK